MTWLGTKSPLFAMDLDLCTETLVGSQKLAPLLDLLTTSLLDWVLILCLTLDYMAMERLGPNPLLDT